MRRRPTPIKNQDERYPVLDRPVVTNDVMVYLRKKYPFDGYKKEYIAFEELRMGAGFAGNAAQAIDCWVMNCYSGISRIAYEVKVSRTDFQKELKNPLKRRAALTVSNYYYFICVKGIAKIEEIPPETGLIEVWFTNNQWDINRANEHNAGLEERNAEIRRINEVEKARWNWKRLEETMAVPEPLEYLYWSKVIDAPYRDSLPPTWNFIASVSRRIKELQESNKRC